MAVRPVAFYAVSDSAHFIGLVALVNSLRLAGHTEPLLVADCGLEGWQRRLLAPHADVRTMPKGALPHLQKGVLPLDESAAVMVLMDADLIVLQSVAPLLDEAAKGRVVVFADPVSHRFDSRWAELLNLSAVRRQPYVNSGLMILPGSVGRRFLQAFAERRPAVDHHRSRLAGSTPHEPFYYVDQDLVNALLGSVVEAEELEILETALAPHPPFTGVRVEKGADLPYVLHHIDRKPWLAATPRNLYTDLLPRYLLAPDVALRLEERQVPLRFRSGALAALERGRVDAAARIHAHRGKLGLRRWFRERFASERA
jgi:hypothetical protein